MSSTCAARGHREAGEGCQPRSTSSSTMPAIFRAARSTRSTSRPGVTPGKLKVFGYINITRAIYAQMKSRGHGVIVNDIGVAGEKFDANYICGSAGNAALMAFTRALGGKSLADNIRVVGINPGPVGHRPPRHAAENPRQEPVRRRKPLQGIPEGPSARPSRTCPRNRRPDGVPRLRPLRLYIGRDLHRRRRHQCGLGIDRHLLYTLQIFSHIAPSERVIPWIFIYAANVS